MTATEVRERMDRMVSPVVEVRDPALAQRPDVVRWVDAFNELGSYNIVDMFRGYLNAPGARQRIDSVRQYELAIEYRREHHALARYILYLPNGTNFIFRVDVRRTDRHMEDMRSNIARALHESGRRGVSRSSIAWTINGAQGVVRWTESRS